VKRNDAERALLNLNAIIQEVLALTSTELSQGGIHLQTALAADLPPVLGDRVQLQQVLLNLLLNAQEAMSGVGWQPRALWITSGASPSGEVTVAVRDSGTGLDPGDGDRIFDAFFARKAEGLGLGCRSVAGSSKPTADDCGRRRTTVPARPCVSPCPQGVPTREAWRSLAKILVTSRAG
jgi:C4-dicarboxylate-specific signal transduction histidine kinase